MAFSEIELKRIDNLVGGLCRGRNRPEFADQLRFEYRVKRHDVTVFEIRPDWRGRFGLMEHEVAKFKFVRTQNAWRLYWLRKDLRWHSYDPLPASPELAVLVREVDRDPYGCFFG